MNELLEFNFERVPPNNLGAIIMDLIFDQNNVNDFTQDGIDVPLNFSMDPKYWENLACANDGIACNINCSTLRIGEDLVKNLTVRLIHYEAVNNVSVLVDSDDCKNAKIFTAEKIYHWARQLSGKYGVDNFYGGMDPAFHVNTQLFSKNGVGPIFSL